MSSPPPIEYRVVGDQPIAGRPGWYTALDVAITTADGAVRLGGLRTAAWFDLAADARHGVLVTDFDPATVVFWDFSRLLWVGPSAHSCLVWSNAEALGHDAPATLLRSQGGAMFLAGPTGDGLPLASDVGVDVDLSTPATAL